MKPEVQNKFYYIYFIIFGNLYIKLQLLQVLAKHLAFLLAFTRGKWAFAPNFKTMQLNIHILKLFSKIPKFLKLDFNKIELCVKLDILKIEFCVYF